MARPTVLTPDILLQLKYAFAIGATDEEACAYAKIGTSSFYRYIEKHPELREESNRLKQEPILKAKQTVVNALSDVKDAQWYLERKVKDEFSPRTDIVSDNKVTIVAKMSSELKEAINETLKTRLRSKPRDAKPS
jgi:transposase